MKEGWEIKTLDVICDLITCGVAARPNYVESGVPFLSAKNVKNGRVIWSDYKFISKETHKELTKNNKPQKGDLLYTRVGSYGEAAIVDSDLEFSVFVSLTLIRPKYNLIHNEYLKNYLNSDAVKQLAKSSISGSGVGNLNVGTVRKFTILLPPLPEQQRIVSFIDEAFEAIDKAIENTQRNLQNAKELFESYLNNVFEKGGEGWECKKLKDITLKIGSGATPKGGQENYKTSGISLIRSMNVYDLQFKPEKLAFIDDEQAKSLSNVTLKEDDVLLNITGASIARCCVVPNNYLPARVNQHVSIIRPNGSFINSIFLNLLLAARFYKNQLLFTGEQGSTRQALTKVQLETFEIRFPNPKEQLKIIAEISSINDETNLLQTNYQQKLRDLEELKKSILNKAFAGEL